MERHTIFKLEKLIRHVAPEASVPCCISVLKRTSYISKDHFPPCGNIYLLATEGLPGSTKAFHVWSFRSKLLLHTLSSVGGCCCVLCLSIMTSLIFLSNPRVFHLRLLESQVHCSDLRGRTVVRCEYTGLPY